MMEHIQTIELGSSQASIEFTSIPQDYDDLILKYLARGDGAVAGGFMQIAINGTGTNNSVVYLFGNGSSASVGNAPNDYIGEANGGNDTANTFGIGEIYISNYSSSVAKSMSADTAEEKNASATGMSIVASLYNSTAAITSIALNINGQNLVSGSTFSLYGIKAGGDGTVTTA